MTQLIAPKNHWYKGYLDQLDPQHKRPAYFKTIVVNNPEQWTLITNEDYIREKEAMGSVILPIFKPGFVNTNR